jgi:signal transduction histidine kinase
LSDPLKQVRFNFPNIAISIFTNRPALQQILHNLFTNAIKYNDKKCIIIDVILEDDDDFYYFTVRDNGMGISENEINKLFMIFNNLEKRDRHGNFGTGIGLSIVKKLVEAEGGNITVSSIPAKGTKFTFTLTKPARH